MKTNCQLCGTKFTKAELTQLQEELEYCSDVRFICDECYDMECNADMTEDYGSDADSGL